MKLCWIGKLPVIAKIEQVHVVCVHSKLPFFKVTRYSNPHNYLKITEYLGRVFQDIYYYSANLYPISIKIYPINVE